MTGTALADGASIGVTTPAGASDPVAYVPRIFTVSGTASGGMYLYVKHRAAGGAACAPSPYTDPGSNWTGFYGLAIDGSFSFQKALTWDAAGAWVFCFWLEPDERSFASAPITQMVTFRQPAATMTPTLSPPVPRPGQRARVTVPGTSEAPRTLFAKVSAAEGAPCASNYDAAAGQSLFSGENVDGGFTGQAVTVQRAPGRYVICFWLAGSSFDPAPVLVQPLTFDVVRPPPVVSSVATLNCPTGQRVPSVQAQKIVAVCMRYRFSTPPAAGARVSVSYVTPAHRTYKTVTVTWPRGTAQTITIAKLPARAYKHRHGTWHVILRVAGRKIKTATFRVT